MLKAILKNGHVFGDMYILTNIMQNSLSYIKSGVAIDTDGQKTFEDTKKLIQGTLSGMNYMLRQARPNLIKGDAMWCLLVSNFNLVKPEP